MHQQLEPGEKLLWSGCPPGGLLLRPSDAFLIPFSLLWWGFAIFWESATLRMGAPTLFSLWGVPFVAVGLYLVAGRFFVDTWLRARTLYGATDRRVLILSQGMGLKVRAPEIRNLPEISLREGRAGRGTITFGPEPPWWMGTPGWPGGTQRSTSPSFEAIDDPQRVLVLIRGVQRRS